MTNDKVLAKIQTALEQDATWLNLSGWYLKTLPESIRNLTQLQELDLSSCELRRLPQWVGNFSQLRKLDLAENQLKSLPKSISKLTQLQILRIDGNLLENPPSWLGNLTQLRELWLSKNQLQNVPDWLGNLTHLQVLWLGENQLQNVPDWLGNLAHLQELILDQNQLRTIPENLGNLTRLWRLVLADNQLQSLPESLGNLIELQDLSLDHNQLQTLPESLGNLTQLQDLWLSAIQLKRLPVNLIYLEKLRILDLSNNPQLTRLPRGLNVNKLDISGCTRLLSLPDELVVKQWLELADTTLTGIPASAQIAELRWRHVPIDARIAFHPETITVQEVLTETNTERRRVLLERMGYNRFMREAQPLVLDTDYDVAGERRLLQIEMLGDEPLVGLSVIDPSTRELYLLRVPPTMKSCHQAAAWIAGFDNPNDYHPLVET